MNKMTLKYTISGTTYMESYEIENNTPVNAINVVVMSILRELNHEITDIKLVDNNDEIYIYNGNEKFEFKNYKEFKSKFGIN